MNGECELGRGHEKKMRRTLNANSSGPRVTPRSLLVHNPHTNPMVVFTHPASPNPNQDQRPPNDDARSFTNAPAGRKPSRDYASLARVWVGHDVRSGN